MKENFRHKAYNTIKNAIIFFEFKPGEKIVEAEVAKKLNISRTPVREALLMLENEKLMECDRTLGFVVKKLTGKEIEEYFSIRKAIESFTVPFIIERITDDEIKLLKDNVAEAEGYVERNDLRNVIRCETEFHAILYKSTKSEIFFQTISGLVDKFQWIRAIGLSASKGARLSVNGHKKLLGAIEKKDAKSFKRILMQHIQHGKEKYESVKGIFM